jgi:hypothetical protein
MMTVVLICGGRTYGRVPFGTPMEQMQAAMLKAEREAFILRETLDQMHRERRFRKVIDGAASGADALAHQWALARGVPTLRFRAQWKTLGKAAGPVRNRQMLVDGRPDLVIAFPGGDGTADMMKQAREAGVEVMDLG